MDGRIITRRRVLFKGQVQGIGFRPTVYRIAKKYNLTGWVKNTSHGVVVEIQGTQNDIERFTGGIRKTGPAQSHITDIEIKNTPVKKEKGFRILESKILKGNILLVPPDMSVCYECLCELKRKTDRRFNYPFINCTNCGPRYSIIIDTPYDRKLTTMKDFRMCGECDREYHDPDDRRFHAQPDACPVCGPKVWLADRGGKKIKCADAIVRTVELLKKGKIIGMRGLGGFHILCDATDESAVKKLRGRKRRPDKPFAVMSGSLEDILKYGMVDQEERELLETVAKPVLLVRKRKNNIIADSVSPGNNYYGVMLPYTPLHYLLFYSHSHKTEFPALVMTSGNRTEEPICMDNDSAVEKLGSIVDYFLFHDRPIRNRLDDSILTVFGKRQIILRRARGFVPRPVKLVRKTRAIFSAGAELKGGFALTREDDVFMSQYIGDLDNEENFRFYLEVFSQLKKLLKVSPEVVVSDLHPGYKSTVFSKEYAEKNKIPLIQVQHHHAHIASVMAEKQITYPVIGVAFDGAGYGEDGNVWGGEFLICGEGKYERVAHLKYIPLPGGDKATIDIWRLALGQLYSVFGEDAGKMKEEYFKNINAREFGVVMEMLKKSFNSPLSSSAGRFFDSVSAIVGLRHTVSFEAQSAMELESLCTDSDCGLYKYGIIGENPPVIDTAGIIKGIIDDIRSGKSKSLIATKFHATISEIIQETCVCLKKKHGINEVALSGGVFQNKVLTEMTIRGLEKRKFRVFTNQLVPPNDGGICLGQAWIGGHLNKY